MREKQKLAIRRGFILWIVTAGLCCSLFYAYSSDEYYTDDEVYENFHRALKDTVENDPALTSNETEVVEELTEEQKQINAFLAKQASRFRVEDGYGPLIYAPYAGGSLFPELETLTDKPGFKIWVDGGVLDYADNTCEPKQLDCSATCCMQSYCAPHMGLCLNYKRRSYTETYIGIMIMTMIVVGIPTCIMTTEFVLNFKMCQYYDEEKDAMLGGMTILEAITWIFTCGKSMMAPEPDKDEFLVQYEEKMAALALAAQAEQENNIKPMADKAPAPNTHIRAKKKAKAANEIVPADDDIFLYEVSPEGVPPSSRRRNKRNCLTRIVCLIFCCDTNDIGSTSHLNALNEQEIEIYQSQLLAEHARKEQEKRALIGANNAQEEEEKVEDEENPEPEATPTPQEDDKKSQGSKKTTDN